MGSQSLQAVSADHVFISYAWEDVALAEWLGAKLTCAGYKVWRDQDKLFGGESMTMDIDQAIKQHTHRMVGILSPASLSKPNPTKERTLALQLSRSRNVPFLILVNAGVEPDDLHWNISDLVFVDFRWNWANGLDQLLKALKKADTPVSQAVGPEQVTSAVIPDGLTRDECEPITTNLFPILKLPGAVLEVETRFRTSGPKWDKARTMWPAFGTGARRCLALGEPADDEWKAQCRVVDAHRVVVSDHIHGISTTNILKSLVKQALRARAMELGLATRSDGAWLHFPWPLVEAGPQSIVGLNGKKTTISLGGTRSYFVAGKGTTPYRYHLAPSFDVRSDVGDGLLVQIRVAVHVTDCQGRLLESRTAESRRKHATGDWWNWEWGNRHIAVATFLAEGRGTIEYGSNEDMSLRVSAAPLSYAVQPSLNDDLIELRRDARRQLRRQNKEAQ